MRVGHDDPRAVMIAFRDDVDVEATRSVAAVMTRTANATNRGAEFVRSMAAPLSMQCPTSRYVSKSGRCLHFLAFSFSNGRTGLFEPLDSLPSAQAVAAATSCVRRTT